MIDVLERDANSRNEELVIDEEGEVSDDEDEEMPALSESREV